MLNPRCLGIVVLLGVAARPSRGATLTLVPVADTTLIETTPTNSNGAQAWVNSGTTQNGPRNRGLFRFDLSPLPTNAVVWNATFTVEVTRIPSDGYASNFFGLRRMLRSWGEGTNTASGGSGLGDPAQPGDATWTHRLFPTHTWSAPGGAPGADFALFDSSSQFIEGKNGYLFESTPELVADVQDWVRRPESNFGWMLLCSAEELRFTARRFGSREDPNYPPQLQVDFLIPPHIDSVAYSNLAFTLSFTAAAEQSYTVQYRDSFATGSWQTLTNLGFFGAAAAVTVTDSHPPDQRFYRLNTN